MSQPDIALPKDQEPVIEIEIPEGFGVTSVDVKSFSKSRNAYLLVEENVQKNRPLQPFFCE